VRAQPGACAQLLELSSLEHTDTWTQCTHHGGDVTSKDVVGLITVSKCSWLTMFLPSSACQLQPLTHTCLPPHHPATNLLGLQHPQDYPFLRWTYPDHYLHKTAWVEEWWEEGSLQRWCVLVLNYCLHMDKARSSLFNLYPYMEAAVKLRHHRDHILALVLAGDTDCLLGPFGATSEGCQASAKVSPHDLRSLPALVATPCVGVAHPCISKRALLGRALHCCIISGICPLPVNDWCPAFLSLAKS
jgi:hypothetical protein